MPLNKLIMETLMPDSFTEKKATAGEEHDSSDETTYKVWIDIEEYDELTGCGSDCDAPGAALATFDTYEEAYDFAAQIDAAYCNYSAPTNATKPFTVVGFWADNEQGFIEPVMAVSADAACNLARKDIASRNSFDSTAAEDAQWTDDCIQIIAVFHGHLNCAFLQT
jgi:hypothetical protein